MRGMRMIPLVALIAMSIACRARNAPQATDASITTTTSAPSAEESCVDRWLAEHGLDEFGSPRGTSYAGGSPLFDETTGKATSRMEYVYAAHPDARRACTPDGGGIR